MNPDRIQALLRQVAVGRTSVPEAMETLRSLPFEDVGFAKIDHHRRIRKGFAEVVLCSGKTPAQVAAIFSSLVKANPQVLGTRATPEHYRAARKAVRTLHYHELARVIYFDQDPKRKKLPGVAVVAAGTSDLPVAEEAALTLDLMGHEPLRIHDVGVAGLHRLVHHLPSLSSANVVVAVAGMEGALPSVLGGLVSAPIVAVPTSIGYGASFGGVAALLSMLNACAPGIAVVNIDNGFGAGYLAAMINRKIHDRPAP